VAVTPSGPTRESVAVVTWKVPAGVPEGTTARVRYDFSPSDYVLQRSRDSATPGRAEIALDEEGTYSSLAVELVSPDGQVGPAATLPDRIDADRTAPSAPTGVRLRDGRIDWVDPVESSTPIVRAHWEYCRGWQVPGTRPCAVGSSTEHPFAFSPDVLPLGPYPGGCTGHSELLTLWLEDAAGNVSKANGGGFGLVTSPACAAPPRPTPFPPPTLRPTPLGLKGRVVALRGRSGRHRVTVTVAVPREAAGTVRLRATRRGAGPRFTRTVKATVRRGTARATFVVPRGVRRLAVRATFAATATHAWAARTAVLRVR
jgi:hypothetical protein